MITASGFEADGTAWCVACARKRYQAQCTVCGNTGELGRACRFCNERMRAYDNEGQPLRELFKYSQDREHNVVCPCGRLIVAASMSHNHHLALFQLTDAMLEKAYGNTFCCCKCLPAAVRANAPPSLGNDASTLIFGTDGILYRLERPLF